jgi:hypothetical protein
MKKLLILLALIPSLGMAQGTTVRATKSTGVLLTPSNFFTGNAISTTTFAEAAATNAYNWAVLDAGGGGGGIFSTSSGGNVATSTNDLVLISGAGLSANQLQFAVSNSTGRVLSVDKEGDLFVEGVIHGGGGTLTLQGSSSDASPSMSVTTSAISLIDAWGDTAMSISNTGVIVNPSSTQRPDFRINGDTPAVYLQHADVSKDLMAFGKLVTSGGTMIQVGGALDIDGQAGGTLSVSNSTTTISVDDTAYVMLTNFDRNDEFSNLTAETGNDSMTATIAGTYLVTVSMDFNGLDNDYYHLAVFKEGVIVPYATANQSPPEYTSKMSVGITSLITLAIGDTLDVRMIRDGAGSPSSPVLRAGTFTALKVR